ncbi:MAG: nucleotidyltransferase domain-containing protein [Pirellulales bacterium]
MKLDGLLRRVTSLIVKACDPEKVVLFGSYAKQQQDVDSDLDILVVGNFQGLPFLLGQELRQSFHGYPIRIDLYVARPQDVEAESTKPFGFLCSVLSSGVLLYKRNGAPRQALDGRLGAR